MKKKFSRSVATYVRRQKALIRRRTQNKDEQEQCVRELIERLK